MTLTTSAFAAGDVIPEPYTCAGAGVSPPLSWRDAPAGTRSLALCVEDPDAPSGTFTHWLVADLPPAPAQLAEGLDVHSAAVGGADPVEGLNDFGRIGYGAPCPPRGHGAHRYHFRLYALDDMLRLERGFTRDELGAAIGGHVLDEADLIGTFGREG